MRAPIRCVSHLFAVTAHKNVVRSANQNGGGILRLIRAGAIIIRWINVVTIVRQIDCAGGRETALVLQVPNLLASRTDQIGLSAHQSKEVTGGAIGRMVVARDRGGQGSNHRRRGVGRGAN